MFRATLATLAGFIGIGIALALYMAAHLPLHLL